MLPTPGLQPHQRDHVTSQAHTSRLSELSVIPGVQGLDPRRRTPKTPPFARAQRFNPGGDSSHAPTTLKHRILIPGGMDLMVTWNTQIPFSFFFQSVFRCFTQHNKSLRVPLTTESIMSHQQAQLDLQVPQKRAASRG